MTTDTPSKAGNRHSPFIQLEDRLLRKLIDTVLIIFTAAATVALVGSLSRIEDTGWLNLYAIHITLFVITVAIALLRHRIPDRLKALFLIAVNLAVALAGFANLGVLSGGIFFLFIAGAIMALIYAWPVILAVFTAFAGICIYAARGFLLHERSPAIDMDLLFSMTSHWINYGITLGFSFLMLMVILLNYRKTIRSLIDTVQEQRDEIAHLATHDHLTGLPSPRLADDRLQMAIHHAKRNDEHATVLYVDLDHFKLINDRYGHDAGDRCLIEAGRRMSELLRAEDTVARIGGDEFLVILGGPESLASAVTVAEKINHALLAPIDWAGHRLVVGCSIGIAQYPIHADDAKTLRQEADAAMYRVKNSGRNGYAIADTP